MRPAQPLPPPVTGPPGWLVAGLVVPAAGLLGLDLWSDLAHGGDPAHALTEAAAIGGLAVALGLMWSAEARRSAHRIAALRAEVQEFRSMLEALRAAAQAAAATAPAAPPEALSTGAPAIGPVEKPDMVAVVDGVFAEWRLTPAEQEVAWLLFKGVSFNDIGAARGTSPRTARDQARALYRKAGVAGRAELSALLMDLSRPD